MFRLMMLVGLILFSAVTYSTPSTPNFSINISEFRKAIFNANESDPDLIYLSNSTFDTVQFAIYREKNRAKIFPDESNLIFAKGYSHETGHYTYEQYAFDCKNEIVYRSFMYFDPKGKLLKISPDTSGSGSEVFKAACK